jgi:hypothetical protein
MRNGYGHGSITRRFKYVSLLLVVSLAGFAPAISAAQKPLETISATATGTSTQMGKIVNVQVIVNQFSTPEDRQILVDAFKKDQTPGLVKALTKMKSVGRIAITGTVGFDLSYIALIPSPTGRKIRFVTNRPIRFAEAYNNGRSTQYDLTAGEIQLDDSDKNKSAGVLYPATKVTIDKKGQLQIELFRNPWKLVNIIDWNNDEPKK